MITSIVVGNPKPRSRTFLAAQALVQALTGQEPTHAVDVVELGAGLLGRGDGAVAEAKEKVAESDLVVVASPTFKASYSGLLKLFLDQFDTGTGLQDVVAIPLMLGAAPHHAMAAEHLLKPVLVELGAVVPTPALYLIDKTAAEPAATADWLARWANTILEASRGCHASRR